MTIIMVAIIGIIIIGAIYFIRWLANEGNNTDRTQKTALEILNERYARGDINRREYDEIRREIDIKEPPLRRVPRK